MEELICRENDCDVMLSVEEEDHCGGYCFRHYSLMAEDSIVYHPDDTCFI